ncbi:MAG: PhoU domain-containing protein [Candidatus Thorarchaeota archaeon]
MNIRRLQQTGGKLGNSFLVIVPMEWVRRHGLKKGDPIVVSEREDGCLLLDPRLPRSGEARRAVIQLESNLKWSITSTYLLGFDEIRIVSVDPLTSDMRDEVRRIIKRFVALEITEENENEIVLQCLVDPSTISVEKAMKRMSLITSTMLRDAVQAFVTGARDLSEYVCQKDEEVDRFFFLMVRELRSATQYPSISEKMGIPPVKALDFRLAVQYIERIADLAVDVARQATASPIDVILAEDVKRIAEFASEMLHKSVTNLFKFDPDVVTWVMGAERDLVDDVGRMRTRIIGAAKDSAQACLQVIECLLRIGETAKDIVDLALPPT